MIIENHSQFSKEFPNSINSSKSSSSSTRNKILNNEFDVLNILNNSSNNTANKSIEINLFQNKFPYCLLWTNIPFLTFFYPIYGDFAIGDSNGKIHFFGGLNNNFNYYKFFQFNLNDYEKNIFDDAIKEIDNIYKEKKYSICKCNSHYYVADFLNKIKYNKKKDYNNKDVFEFGKNNLKFINKKKCFCFYLPYFISVCVLVLVIYVLFIL